MFEKLYGNDDVKSILAKMVADIKKSRESFSSLLFLGSAGIGKKLFALEFARVINCLGSGEAFCACSSCSKYSIGAHPNIILEDCGDKAISVELSRRMVAEASLCSDESQKKVVILNINI